MLITVLTVGGGDYFMFCIKIGFQTGDKRLKQL